MLFNKIKTETIKVQIHKSTNNKPTITINTYCLRSSTQFLDLCSVVLLLVL